MYTDDDMLMLSGIQHYRFCPRQWALIHIEQQWMENRLTQEGQILHKHVDDPSYRQKSGNCICLRSVSLSSYKLGLYGISDLVELHPTEDNVNYITHPSYPGKWMPYPVEYKHGRPKHNAEDSVQLAAQAMCLEEIYDIHIHTGAIYYAEIRRREEIEISECLRDTVYECTNEMHKIFNEESIPPIAYNKKCKKCSLIDICMPQSDKCTKVKYYLNKSLYEETS